MGRVRIRGGEAFAAYDATKGARAPKKQSLTPAQLNHLITAARQINKSEIGAVAGHVVGKTAEGVGAAGKWIWDAGKGLYKWFDTPGTPATDPAARPPKPVAKPAPAAAAATPPPPADEADKLERAKIMADMVSAADKTPKPAGQQRRAPATSPAVDAPKQPASEEAAVDAPPTPTRQERATGARAQRRGSETELRKAAARVAAKKTKRKVVRTKPVAKAAPAVAPTPVERRAELTKMKEQLEEKRIMVDHMIKASKADKGVQEELRPEIKRMLGEISDLQRTINRADLDRPLNTATETKEDALRREQAELNSIGNLSPALGARLAYLNGMLGVVKEKPAPVEPVAPAEAATQTAVDQPAAATPAEAAPAAVEPATGATKTEAAVTPAEGTLSPKYVRAAPKGRGTGAAAAGAPAAAKPAGGKAEASPVVLTDWTNRDDLKKLVEQYQIDPTKVPVDHPKITQIVKDQEDKINKMTPQEAQTRLDMIEYKPGDMPLNSVEIGVASLLRQRIGEAPTGVAATYAELMAGRAADAAAARQPATTVEAKVRSIPSLNTWDELVAEAGTASDPAVRKAILKRGMQLGGQRAPRTFFEGLLGPITGYKKKERGREAVKELAKYFPKLAKPMTAYDKQKRQAELEWIRRRGKEKPLNRAEVMKIAASVEKTKQDIRASKTAERLAQSKATQTRRATEKSSYKRWRRLWLARPGGKRTGTRRKFKPDYRIYQSMKEARVRTGKEISDLKKRLKTAESKIDPGPTFGFTRWNKTHPAPEGFPRKPNETVSKYMGRLALISGAQGQLLQWQRDFSKAQKAYATAKHDFDDATRIIREIGNPRDATSKLGRAFAAHDQMVEEELLTYNRVAKTARKKDAPRPMTKEEMDNYRRLYKLRRNR